MYSGPEPPSGGVSRPPFAEIAPHWTQFDGFTSTCTSPLPASAADLVDLRRAHVHPGLGEVSRDGAPDPDVVGLVVPRPVPREEDGGELVERELAVRLRIAGCAAGPDQRALGVRLAEHVERAAASPSSPSSRWRARRRRRSPCRRPGACSAPRAGRRRRSSRAAPRRRSRRRRAASATRRAEASGTRPPPPSPRTRSRSGSPSASARSRARPPRRRAAAPARGSGPAARGSRPR